MNRTKIEWTDYTWNPVTGCWGPGGTEQNPQRCSYCYAQRMSMRFVPGALYEGYDPFVPTFHPNRLSQPSKVVKPSKIFVCSMGDLFGDWVPREWIEDIIGVVMSCEWHTFQFLTKNPKRYREFNPWPKNCWLGTTVTCQEDTWRLLELLGAESPVRFMSHEPLTGPIDINTIGYPQYPIKTAKFWAIIGAMTGPGSVKPDPAWVQSLINQYRAAGVPIFIKDNLIF